MVSLIYQYIKALKKIFCFVIYNYKAAVQWVTWKGSFCLVDSKSIIYTV